MRNRRVLVLNHFAAPRGEAGGTRHVELFSRLEGWEHLIIASNLNPQTGRKVGDSDGFVTVPVVGYSSNGISRILNWVSYAVSATLRGLRVGRVDVVYGSSPHLLAALAAWVLAVLKRAPFVLEVRDLWPKVLVDMNHLSETSPVYRVLTALEEFLYARAKKIVVMAEGSRTELVARGVEEAKIVYIPNGADPEDFEPSAPRDELRARYGFDKVTAVYAGAHGPANGLDLLLDGAESVPEVDVVLVGGGVLKEKLRQDAERRGLANVRFMDPIPKDEIPDLLAAADIGLHVLADVELFRSAVSPNKVFDYMAAGLPTLTNCPGLVSDLIRTANAGTSVKPNDIGQGLLALATTDPLERKELGVSGRSWIAANQSRQAMAARLGDAISGTAARRNAHLETSTMHICFFAPVDDPAKLEHVGFYRQDLDALRALGHHVTVATKWKEIPWDCDVMFIWWWTWAFKPLIKARIRRIPAIITGTFNLRWGSGDYFHRPIVQRALLRASLKAANMNMFVSHHELDPIVKMGWTSRAKYSPHCVDTDVYSPGVEERLDKTLLTIGWLRKENAIRKGMPDIIQALPEVLKVHPDAKLLVVGDPDTGRQYLEDLAHNLGVLHAITFLGKVDEQEKIHLLRSCTAYLQPSQYEGFGLAILEAMSCGSPVITRAVGAVPEVVGEAGLYSDSPRTLGQDISRLLDDRSLQKTMGEAARRRAIQEFPLSRRANDINETLRDVTSGPSNA